MIGFFLSKSALRAVTTAFPEHTSLTGSRELLWQHLIRQPKTPTAVFADIETIDPSLQLLLAEAQRSHGSQLSIFPWDDRFSNQLLSKIACQSPPIGADGPAVGIYDGEIPPGVSRMIAPPWVERLNVDNAASAVANRQWQALGIVTAGRQTYCQLGKGCLHPGIEHPGPGVVTPESVNCVNWFLQSCHSPFVWRSYGDYLSIPLALHLKGKARSIICSVRVQSYLPGLIDEWIACISVGLTAAAACIRLNAFVSATRMDFDPFMIVGLPDAAVSIPPTTVRGSGVQAEATDITMPEVAHENAHNMLANLAFMCGDESFGFGQKPTPGAERHLYELCAILELFTSEHRSSIAEERSIKARQGRSARRMHTSKTSSWQRLRNRVKQLWDADSSRPGYYYRFGPPLEVWYLPISAHVDSTTGSLAKVLRHAGTGAPRDYCQRSLRITPQGLVTRDTSSIYEKSITTGIDANHEFSVKYTNNTEHPQFVFAFHRLTDPNNVSASFNRKEPRSIVRHKIYKVLLKEVTVTPKQWESSFISPGESMLFCGQVNLYERKLFYLLVEVHLFIDLCWNWLSFTLALGGIDDWLRSDDYRHVIPPTVTFDDACTASPSLERTDYALPR